MTKIVMLVNSKKYSGLENVALSIMDKLKNEFEFVYVTQNGPIVDVLKEKKVNYYLIESMSIKEIKKMIKNENPDIIHAHDFRASFVASLCKKNIPFISHLHNNPLWLKRICPNSLAFLCSSIRADKILTVSDSVKDDFVFKNIVGKKFINISNPVDTSIIRKSAGKTELAKKYDLISVARLTEQKDPMRFVNIMENLKEIYSQIKVAWIGDGELEQEFLNAIENKGLSENISYLGFQKNPYKFMKQSSIFILTSKWEGYGLVAFEALSLGLPCVVSKVGGLTGIVDNLCGELCVTDDDFVNEVVNLLKNKNYYKQKSELAIEKSNKLDNHTKYYASIRKNYKELVVDTNVNN